MKFMMLLSVFVTGMLTGGAAIADNDSLLRALATDNHFALMRHALAPGNGDPSHFDVTDCTTQRNLNEGGRRQATGIGDYLRSQSGMKLQVYSSQWCRCMETARLLDLGSVQAMPQINSFYADRSTADDQTTATRKWLTTADLPVVLVTHQVNITALTGVYPSSGEIVVMKREDDGTLIVAGSITL